MIEIHYVKDYKLRDKEDIRDGCDVKVAKLSEIKKEIEKFKNTIYSTEIFGLPEQHKNISGFIDWFGDELKSLKKNLGIV